MRLLWFILLVNPLLIWGQQIPDTSFVPPENKPAYAFEKGPWVYIDGGHGNFHTADNRFAPFAKLLTGDGYRIKAGTTELNKQILEQIDILVISNALHADNQKAWVVPILSAFTEIEVNHIKQWVAGGGKLLLIADHMPFPGAVSYLADSFGFAFNNGFAMTEERQWPPAVFSIKNNGLKPHIIVSDKTYGPAVEQVATFTGQGFQIPAEAFSILEFDEGFYSLMPDTAWQFSPNTPKVNLKGWSQGAVRTFGKGRIAIFGEAAMFTAQIAGPNKTKIGFNSPVAPHNAQFALNVMHWLDELIMDK